MRAMLAVLALTLPGLAAAQGPPEAPTAPTAPVAPATPTPDAAPAVAPEAPAPPDEPVRPAPARREFEVGLTGFGFVNGSFIDEPDDSDKVATLPSGQQVLVAYPGFGGVGGGGGLGIIGMWRGIVGLELQLFTSFDGGKGNLDINGTKFEFEMGQWAWHLPLLLRVALPTDPVRPFLFGGPEWIFPGEADFKFVSADARDDWGATANDYMVWAFGFGFEFMLPVDGVDLRIPLTFRGAYNTDLGKTSGDRTVLSNCTQVGSSVTCERQDYLTEWQYQAFVTLGLSYYFL